MARDVILPALGMSQDTGKIVQWLKREGEQVIKGEPLLEVETDKATVEIEAPADGVLARVSAAAGDVVPVGQVIAAILAPDEVSQASSPSIETDRQKRVPIPASPLASQIAAEHNLDLSMVKASGRRIQKADVLTYLQSQEDASANVLKRDQQGTPLQQASLNAPTQEQGSRQGSPYHGSEETRSSMVGRPLAAPLAKSLLPASPKARRLATEQGKDLTTIKGSGPGGAVLTADVLAAKVEAPFATVGSAEFVATAEQSAAMVNGASELVQSNIWRIMAERTTQSWTNVPHFYLIREANASRLISWREHMLKKSATKVTYTDLLVKIVAAALRMHPRLNASWSEGKLSLKQEVHIGLAVAVEEGLVVPVIHQADTLTLGEIAKQRTELVTKAQAGKLRPVEISDGTFTISNLGMYNVDAFNAIINQPQAAILAVGRIAERVVPVNGQPAVQPMMVLTLSCDHRAVDGARGAQFLESIANFIEEPLGLLG